MEFAVDYTETIGNKNQVINRINKVRKHKCMFLPFELVGVDM